MNRRSAWPVAAVVVVTLSCSPREQSPTPSAISAQPTRALPATSHEDMRLAVAWLMAQQGADGGWRSATYGQMKGGVGNTALALYAISCMPESLRSEHRDALLRGVRFLAEHLNEQGYAEGPDRLADYPTYATALLLIAMEQLDVDEWPEQRKRMTDYLIAAQQGERHHVGPGELDYGGWNQTGGDEVGKRLAGETNVSVTSFVLEALQREHSLDDPTRAAALKFLAHCQNRPPEQPMGDGGFFFTPLADDPRNKAGAIEPAGALPIARSYGTATAEGIAALLACDVPRTDPRVQAALDWFSRQAAIDTSPGFAADEVSQASRNSLQYYYWFAVARCIHLLPESTLAQSRTTFRQAILAAQRPDGSWKSSHPLMREDDPLIATSLAAAALALLAEERSQL